MKKYILSMIFIQTIASAISFQDVPKWYTSKDIPTMAKYSIPGDILILKPEKQFVQSFGHVLIMGENHKFVDFPNYSMGYREVPASVLALENRKVILLRYRYTNKEFEKRVIDSIKKTLNYKYSIFTPVDSSIKRTYCSLFVYKVLEEANRTNESLIPDNNNFILPIDFLRAGKNFYIVDFKYVLGR